MKSTLRSILAAFFIVFSASFSASAQSSIEKIIEPLKDGDKGSSVVYREKRNPQTRAIVESSLFLTFNDNKLANKIIEAIKKERPNSVDYSAYNEKRGKTYRIKFVDKEGASSEYGLYQEGAKWSLTVKTVNRAASMTKSSKWPKGKRRTSSVPLTDNTDMEPIMRYVADCDPSFTIYL